MSALVRHRDSIGETSLGMEEEEIAVRVENGRANPERTLRPIMYASWLLGVGVGRPKNSPKWMTMLIRAIHFAVCSVIVAFSAMDFADFGKEFTSELFEIMYCVNETGRHLAAYYYVYHIIRHYDKWAELMEILERFDENVGKGSAPIDDRSVRIGQILAILLVLLFGPISLIAHVLYYYLTAPDQIFASDLLLYYTIAQTLINSFVFDIVVYAIRQRFRAIGETMGQSSNERFGIYRIASKIRRIRRLYNELCCAVTTVNEIYGVDLLLCSTNAFVLVVAKLFRIYMSAVERKNGFIFLNNVIWMIYGGQLVAMCWVCTLTHREINKIGLCVSEFALNGNRETVVKSDQLASSRNFWNEEPRQRLERAATTTTTSSSSHCRSPIRDELNDFSLELHRYRLAFTACDYFEMDNSLLTRVSEINRRKYSFVSVITTYLIILVQFYKPERYFGRAENE
ncbi:unnamed protein product [Xylocopa violacea]|uniref:Gustatory receptor n=1 Tax=Xylocopa violacea TaxID=135666 RepID=A0ABP1NFJ0_XYLVO